jgi:benzoylformate decarboxylase
VQYAVTALWTAAAYSVPITVLVLQNREYAILKWFAEAEEVKGAPGLDLPELDTAAVAGAYGVDAQRVSGAEALREALAGAHASDRPALVEVPVTPGMALF